MNVQRNGGDFKRGMLGLACPDKLWVQMWIIGIAFLASSWSVSGVTSPTGGLFRRSLSECV